MKRELWAALLLLLLAAGSLWHLRSADRLTGLVEDSLDRAEQAARQEDYEAALAALREGRRLWQASGVYVQIFFRHPDLDSLQGAFAASVIRLWTVCRGPLPRWSSSCGRRTGPGPRRWSCCAIIWRRWTGWSTSPRERCFKFPVFR